MRVNPPILDLGYLSRTFFPLARVVAPREEPFLSPESRLWCGLAVQAQSHRLLDLESAPRNFLQVRLFDILKPGKTVLKSCDAIARENALHYISNLAETPLLPNQKSCCGSIHGGTVVPIRNRRVRQALQFIR